MITWEISLKSYKKINLSQNTFLHKTFLITADNTFLVPLLFREYFV